MSTNTPPETAPLQTKRFSQILSEKLAKFRDMNPLHMLKTYAFFYQYVKPFKVRFFLAMLITFPLGMMDGMLAASIKPFFDALAEGRSTLDFGFFTASINAIPLFIIAFNVVQGGLNYVSFYLTSYVGAQLSNAVRFALYERLLAFDIQKSQALNSGFVIARMFYDPNQVQNALLQNTKTIISRFSSMISIALVMFSLNWKLCLIAYGIVATIFFPVAFVRKKVMSLLDSEAKIYAGVLSVLMETLNGMKVVHSFTLYRFLEDLYNKAQRDMYDRMMGIAKAQAVLQPVNYTITSLGIAVVLWYGSYLVMSKEITAGALIAFVTSMLMLYRPMRMLGNTVIMTQQLMLALERVIEILTQKTYQRRDTNRLPSVEPLAKQIEFKNVSFKYDTRNDMALENVSVKLPVGQMVALVGRSGSGKTTLADLIQGFYDLKPGNGHILYDGLPISAVNLDSLRRQMAYVSQDTFLFEGTIIQNVRVGRPEATEEEVRQALQQAHLSDFIESLPSNIDTHVGERGIMLSGGQRQRLAIARAFLKNAPILILDEATSALDSESELAVQQALDDLMENRTTLVIAHRLSTIRNADRIVVMDKGHVAEEGSHEALMAKRGIYYHLYNTQYQVQETEPTPAATAPQEQEQEQAQGQPVAV
ncbi:MAG: ABC transporter ATP-binding protein [Cyanobacteria bacterium HKST-UBA03]|nr:ABC transporter ATP-binding protein [Cyanobacteria bacterium HKST-UBA03]